MKRLSKAFIMTMVLTLPYLAGSSLTFGYLWNKGWEDIAAAGAVFWPFYWVFRAGVELTKGWGF